METEKEIIDVKKIGNYKIKFKTKFDNKKSDFLTLNISITDDLGELLKKSVIEEKVGFEFYNGETYEKLMRYKVKGWIFRSLLENYKDILFCSKLVEEGKLNLKISDVKCVDKIIDDTKQNTKQLIQTIMKYSDIDIVVNFNVQKN